MVGSGLPFILLRSDIGMEVHGVRVFGERQVAHEAVDDFSKRSVNPHLTQTQRGIKRRPGMMYYALKLLEIHALPTGC